MPAVRPDDVTRMREALYIDSRRKASRYWVLLVLAAVIATAGLISSSEATVIGAMIVAPLMTPILGTALALVLADRTHFLRSAGLVVAGALLVVGIGMVMAFVVHPVDAFAGNAQVEARTSATLIDLVAALATGTVGAFALIRSEVSDTLPGVAIAISLVPPLATVGLLLEVGRFDAAAGALLLFATNVAAIIATGVVVLLLYRVRDAALEGGRAPGRLRGAALVAVAAALLVLSVPLAATSIQLFTSELDQRTAAEVSARWAVSEGWQLESVQLRGDLLVVTVLGPPPVPDARRLHEQLAANGLAGLALRVRLAVGGTQDYPAQADRRDRSEGHQASGQPTEQKRTLPAASGPSSVQPPL